MTHRLALGLLLLTAFSCHAGDMSEPVPATIFLIYALFVSFSDTFLKPMLLGRGVDVPMLVILLGAIGGMISAGIIGLFVGAVILALGWQLFSYWVGAIEPEEIDNNDEKQ